MGEGAGSDNGSDNDSGDRATSFSGSENSATGASADSSSANEGKNEANDGRGGWGAGSDTGYGSKEKSWADYLDSFSQYVTGFATAGPLGVVGVAAKDFGTYAYDNRNNPAVQPGPRGPAAQQEGPSYEWGSESRARTKAESKQDAWAAYLDKFKLYRQNVKASSQFNSLLDDE